MVIKSLGDSITRTKLSEGKQPLFKKSGAKIFTMLGHGLCRGQRP
jgi:hypothetical protein